MNRKSLTSLVLRKCIARLIYWADPKEQLVVVTMTVGPGEIRKYYREQMAALVYGAMEK